MIVTLLLACGGDLPEPPASEGSPPWEASAEELSALQSQVEGLVQRVSELEEELETVSQALAEAEASLEEIESSGGTASCPEDMVEIADFCIDRYKGSVWSEPSCEGELYGVARDDYPSTFPDSGDWEEPLYACSVEGVQPSGSLTWFQAAQACVLSGKRLCSNQEWQIAAAGSPPDHASCYLKKGSIGSEVVETGSYSDCVSHWGVIDPVGIRWDYTGEWLPGGAAWMTQEEEGYDGKVIWPEDYGDGWDSSLNLNSRAMSQNGFVSPGMPGALLRGGDYNMGQEGGHFSMSVARGPSHHSDFIGFRCCRNRL